MTIKEFAEQVKKMRELQSAYFKARTNTALFAAKQQEQYVDDLIEGILKMPDTPQPDLFTQTDDNHANGAN